MLYSIFFMIEALSIFNYSFMVGDAAVTALKQLQLKPVTKTFYKKQIEKPWLCFALL